MVAKEIRQEARKELDGKLGKLILTNVLYVVITFLL